MPHRVCPVHRGNKHKEGEGRERQRRHGRTKALVGEKPFSFPFLNPALGLFDMGSKMPHKYRNPIQTHCKSLLNLSHESCPEVITVCRRKTSLPFPGMGRMRLSHSEVGFPPEACGFRSLLADFLCQYDESWAGNTKPLWLLKVAFLLL